MLDRVAFGKVTITSSIRIINDGVGVAAIGIGSGNPITINAGASDIVYLRGLTIEGISSASNGILFNAGGNLAIENCVTRGFVNGINIAPSTSSSFSVSNTIASNNGRNGILVQPTGSAVVKGALGKVSANNNAFGIFVNGQLTTGGSLNVTIVDSEASNNGGDGVVTLGLATAVMVRNVMVRNVVASSNNGFGLAAEASSILRVAHSVVTGNGTGVNTSSGGILDSYGDNDIDGNTTNGSPTAVIPTR